MKHILSVSLFLMVVASGVCGQTGTKETKSPKEVVEAFWKLETEGGRLTPEGWHNAGSFFVRPSPPPQKKTIAVISGKYKYSVDERWVKGNQAEIANGYVDLGRIDSDLHYSPPDSRFYDNKTAVLYHLVLTDRHWEIGPDGITEREVSGPLAWRIEKPEPILWITVDTAIRFVKGVGEKTTDPIIKKNAEQTLAKLMALR
jgi:hypothetical protein